MIAEPDSSSLAPEPASAPAPVLETSPLSASELYRLTLYKWRYCLEAYGFASHEVRTLVFLKWLHACRRISP